MPHVVIKDARILFRNFAGKPTKFNAAGGKRTFAVILPPDLAEELAADGWNVKELAPRDEEDSPTPYIQVEASWRARPPRILTITGGGKRRTDLNESTVELLDYAEIEHIDLSLTPYHWEVNGNEGTKAYLRSMYVTLVEDELEDMYALGDEDPGPQEDWE